MIAGHVAQLGVDEVLRAGLHFVGGDGRRCRRGRARGRSRTPSHACVATPPLAGLVERDLVVARRGDVDVVLPRRCRSARAGARRSSCSTLTGVQHASPRAARRSTSPGSGGGGARRHAARMASVRNTTILFALRDSAFSFASRWSASTKPVPSDGDAATRRSAPRDRAPGARPAVAGVVDEDVVVRCDALAQPVERGVHAGVGSARRRS